MHPVRKLLYLLVPLTVSCSGVRQLSESGFGAFEADLEVLSDGTVAVSWYDTRHHNGEIYLRFMDGNFKPLSDELRLTENQNESYEPDIVPFGEYIAATWYEVNSEQRSRVLLGLWDRMGKQLWMQAISTPSVDARIPVVVASENRLFVAWVESVPSLAKQEFDVHITGSWIDESGRELMRLPQLASADATTWNLNADIREISESTQVFLTYDSAHETSSNELYVTKIDNAVIQTNRISADDGFPSKYPDLAIKGEDIALTWFDNRFANNEIYLSIANETEIFSPGIAERFELGAQRVTHSEGDSMGAYLAWSENDLGLAWSDDSTGAYQVYFQRFNSELRPLGQRERISNGKDDSLIPSIGIVREGFVMAWNTVSVFAHESDASQSRSEIRAGRAP